MNSGANVDDRDHRGGNDRFVRVRNPASQGCISRLRVKLREQKNDENEPGALRTHRTPVCF